MTQDFIDLPDKARIEVPLTFGDRVTAEACDTFNCTVANALGRTGIIWLAHRGASRYWVEMRLDPKVYKWAKKDPQNPAQSVVYRGYLNDHSVTVTAELDSWKDKRTLHARFKRNLKRMAMALPQGLDTPYDVIVIKSAPPSQKKGYRQGSRGPQAPRGPRGKRALAPRSYNTPDEED